jgi:hypothetical protein
MTDKPAVTEIGVACAQVGHRINVLQGWVYLETETRLENGRIIFSNRSSSFDQNGNLIETGEWRDSGSAGYPDKPVDEGEAKEWCDSRGLPLRVHKPHHNPSHTMGFWEKLFGGYL